MKITILTIFPDIFDSFLSNSIIKRAISKNIVSFEIKNIRDYTNDKHHRTDNPPFGGGAGLIMMCQPIIDCLNSVKDDNSKVFLTSPRGTIFNQQKAYEMSKLDHLIFICGHYEGVDERVNKYIDEHISIGDFILTGGEAAIIPLIDAITRLIPGVISNESINEESFNNGLLEYPQYTFPYDFQGDKVPDILFSGNHQAISKYHQKESLRITKKYRFDLFEKYPLSKEDQKLLQELNKNETPSWEQEAILKGKKFMK